MSEMPTPQQNHLLAALSAEVQNRLAPHLELVPMPLGKVLYESGDALHHAYFPTDSIVSLLYVMENGASAEISVVGNEGLIGIAVFMKTERRFSGSTEGPDTTGCWATIRDAASSLPNTGLSSANAPVFILKNIVILVYYMWLPSGMRLARLNSRGIQLVCPMWRRFRTNTA